jgi:hypothetical protein
MVDCGYTLKGILTHTHQGIKQEERRGAASGRSERDVVVHVVKAGRRLLAGFVAAGRAAGALRCGRWEV